MAKEKEHQPIVIYPDRGKHLRANGTTYLLGGGLALLAFTPWHRATAVTRMIVMLSRGLLLVWGWFCIPALARLLFPKPVVTVNDEGISYHPPWIGPFAFGGSLAWEEIKALYAGELAMRRWNGRTSIQRFLCILPRDVDAFLRPYTVMNKTVLTMLMMQVSSPFVLPEAMLPLSIDELLARVRTQYADTIYTHGIELRKEYKGSFTASSRND
jgi:hypothetical protein